MRTGGHCGADHTDRNEGHSFAEHMPLRLCVRALSQQAPGSFFSTPLQLVILDTEELQPVQSMAEDLACGPQDRVHQDRAIDLHHQKLPHLACFLCYTTESQTMCPTILHCGVSDVNSTVVCGISENSSFMNVNVFMPRGENRSLRTGFSSVSLQNSAHLLKAT